MLKSCSWSWITLVLLVTGSCLQAATPPRLVPRSAHWKAELVAAAPTVRYPCIVTCTPDGRVLVGEDPMDIVTRADKTQGRILCLHPSGKITVFAEQLYAPFGLLYLDGKVYVHHSPRLSLFRDEEGVGKDCVDLIACTNPKPWALDWNDHVPANLRLAMDGFLYMSVGDKGIYGAVGRDGKPAELHGGGVLRLRPDATGLEVFCRGTRNHLDVLINAEDDLFTYDNTDEKDWWSRLAHMVEGGYYGYPWDHQPRQPYVLWCIADFGAGAATATVAYNEDALPPEYRGNLFLADFGKAQVLRVRVARDGASYKVVEREDFFAQVPEDFRPVGLAFAPDGLSFYVTDWQHRDVKTTEKTVVGRLWKVSYLGRSHATAAPAWYLPAAQGKKITTATRELVEALSHPAHAVRMVAQRRLAERGPEAVAPLRALLADRQAPARARWHALWALDALDAGVQARQTILALLNDPEVSVRRQALRQLGTRRVAEARAACEALLRDPDASVRLHAATALGRIGDATAASALVPTLDDPDPVVRHVTYVALNRLGRAAPEAWPMIAAGLASDKPAVREGTLFALRETYDVPVVGVLAAAARNAALLPETRAAVLHLLAQLHKKPPPWKGEWWAYHPVNLPRPARTVEWAGTAAALAALRGGLTDPLAGVRRAGVEGLREAGAVQTASDLRELFRRETDEAVRRSILRALGAFKDAAAEKLLAEVVADPGSSRQLVLEAIAAGEQVRARELLLGLLQSEPKDLEIRVAVVAAVGKLRDAAAFPLLVRQLQSDDRQLRRVAAEALGQLGGERVVEAVLPLLNDADLEVRRTALAVLGRLKSPRAVPALTRAFLQDETRFEAAAALAQVPDLRAVDAYFYGLGSANPSLRESCRKALAMLGARAVPVLEARLEAGLLPAAVLAELQQVFPATASRKLHAVRVSKLEPAAYLAFALEHAGDAERGRKLFFDAKGIACAKCHRVGGEGEDVGPDLSGIGAQYQRKDLAESILFPSKVIREGYQAVVVATTQGQLLTGLVRGETAEALTLQDAEGRRHVIAKQEIEERRPSGVSLMPEGLNSGLSLQDFADLVAYLETLKKPPAPPADPLPARRRSQ